MKITKTFKRKHYRTFFWSEDPLSICSDFISNFITIPTNSNITVIITVNVTLSTTNPKKKAYKAVKRVDHGMVKINDSKYTVCWSERNELSRLGIEEGNTFWVKVTII